MKRSEKESINRANVNVTRQSNEPEDMDLAAEATAGAPAKSLESDPKPAAPQATARHRRPAKGVK